MSVFAKDPSSTLDYSFDWTHWLAPGEAITTSSWSIEPDGADSPVLLLESVADTVTVTNVAGGQSGNRYRLNCRIETDLGRTAERSTAIRVMEV